MEQQEPRQRADDHHEQFVECQFGTLFTFVSQKTGLGAERGQFSHLLEPVESCLRVTIRPTKRLKVGSALSRTTLAGGGLTHGAIGLVLRTRSHRFVVCESGFRAVSPSGTSNGLCFVLFDAELQMIQALADSRFFGLPSPRIVNRRVGRQNASRVAGISFDPTCEGTTGARIGRDAVGDSAVHTPELPPSMVM